VCDRPHLQIGSSFSTGSHAQRLTAQESVE
jgi:hypothetical protein